MRENIFFGGFILVDFCGKFEGKEYFFWFILVDFCGKFEREFFFFLKVFRFLVEFEI